jgi:hypothetical protein
MVALLCFFLAFLVSPFKARSQLEAENAVLRHQLNVLRRKVRCRVPLTNKNRWFSGCIDGSRQFSRRWLSFVLRRWCTGIGPAFAVVGAGSHARGEGGRKSRRSSAY